MNLSQSGQCIVITRSRLRPEYADEYRSLAEELLALVQASPGFVSLERYTSDDGERLSIATFADAESAKAWRDQPRHLEAQRLGRERLLAEYSIAVCQCVRAYSSPPPATPPPTR